MKVIFFGLGSIGKKHLSNLRLLCDERQISLEVHAYRSSKGTGQEIAGVQTIYDQALLDSDYDVAFITNPTSLHLTTLETISAKANYIFLEKPAFEKSKDITKFEGIQNKVYVAAPLRYKTVMSKLKEVISDNKVISGRVICSTYLPDWRKDDYRKSYSANPDLGGGIELDCIHELDYVIDLFGFPENSLSLMGKKSKLAIQSNDTALYLFEYEDKFLEIHLDYYGRVPQRKIELITEDSLIEVDLLNNRLIDKGKQTEIMLNEEPNKMYLRELVYFLDNVLTEKENHNNLNHANQVLNLAKE